MALTGTTLSAALGANDTKMNVTAGTGFVAKNICRLDDELVRVLDIDPNGTCISISRGLRGTRAVAHNKLTVAVTGTPAEFAALLAIGPLAPLPRTYSYGSLPQNLTIAPGLHFLDGTTGSTTDLYTLANPSIADDGLVMTIMSRGGAAYLVDNTSGFNHGSTASDRATFTAAVGNSMTIVASGGYWNVIDTANVSLG